MVYNTSGWEHLEILKLLDGIVDIYLPDFKYFDSYNAKSYSAGAVSYPEITKQALLEMQRQVGVAKPANGGVMYKGLMIRHLVMPNNISGSREVIQWISKNLPKDAYVNIMNQYHPCYEAFHDGTLNQLITTKEYYTTIRMAQEVGLHRGF